MRFTYTVLVAGLASTSFASVHAGHGHEKRFGGRFGRLANREFALPHDNADGLQSGTTRSTMASA